jgi:hypothetical protein
MSLRPFVTAHQRLIKFQSDADYELALELVAAGFGLQIFSICASSFCFAQEKLEFMITNGCVFDFEHIKNAFDSNTITILETHQYVDLWINTSGKHLNKGQWKILIMMALSKCSDVNFKTFFDFLLDQKSNFKFTRRHLRTAFICDCDIYYFEEILNSVRTKYSDNEIFIDLLDPCKKIDYPIKFPYFDLFNIDADCIKSPMYIYRQNSLDLTEYLYHKGFDIYNPKIFEHFGYETLRPTFIAELYNKGLIMHELLPMRDYIYQQFDNLAKCWFWERDRKLKHIIDTVSIMVKYGYEVKQIFTIAHNNTETLGVDIIQQVDNALCEMFDQYKDLINAEIKSELSPKNCANRLTN